jgi:hypothetical protein
MNQERTLSTRADRIRARREQQSNDRIKQRTGAKVRYAAETPMTVRGGLGTPVLRRTAAQKVRRKIAIPVSKMGAEVILPAIPVIKPGWRLLSVILTLGLFATGIFMYNAPEFRVHAVEINGLQRLTAEDIKAGLNIAGVSVFTLNPQQVEQSLQAAFPELYDISVKVFMPARVIINMQERIPVVGWRANDNTLWCDEEGVLFPPRGKSGQVLTIQVEGDLPLLMPELGSSDQNSEYSQSILLERNDPLAEYRKIDPVILRAAIQLSQSLPADTEIVYNQENGLGWRDNRSWNVYVGRNLDNLDVKLKIYDAMTKNFEKQGIQPAMISIEFLNAPYYRSE